jgi:DNA-binding transcriptional LysR family regulator
MNDIDMNLLTALDVLLAECSVTSAARRLSLSTSAMSRTLTRLRAATGDPLLVRAGRVLVPTPHALALRERVRQAHQDARLLLSPPAQALDIARLEQTFTIRTGKDFSNASWCRWCGDYAKPHLTYRCASLPSRTRMRGPCARG